VVVVVEEEEEYLLLQSDYKKYIEATAAETTFKKGRLKQQFASLL